MDSVLNSTVHTMFLKATAPLKAAGYLRLIRKYGTEYDIKFLRKVNDIKTIMGPDGPTLALVINAALRLLVTILA